MSSNTHLLKPSKVLGTLELHYVGEVAVIVMKSGDNRLNPAFVDSFNKLLDEVESSSCKGLITTGTGKFYSNGLDLKKLETLPGEELKDFFFALNEMLIRLLLFPLPTLAALNGHAFAGGALVAFAHDFRVQNKDKGWLCLNEVWISRQFANFHYLYLRNKIGGGIAYSDAVVLGRRFTAKESLDYKLVHAAVAQSALLSESCHLLKSFYGKSGYPRDSLGTMKRAVYSDAVKQHELDAAELKDVESDDHKGADVPKARL